MVLGVGHALRRLRSAVSLQALFSHATYGLCETIGFERAVLFSLEQCAGRGEHVRARRARGRARPEQLHPEPLALGPWLHESEVLRRRQAVLVADAAGDPRALALCPATRPT